MHLAHPSHHIKVSFYQIFPALARMYVFLPDVKGLTDGEQLLGAKDSAIVGDEALRRTKLLDGGVEHNQDTRQVLTLKGVTGENGAREGIHDGDHIKRAFDLRNAMLFDVADIKTPPLMASGGLERVRLRLVRLPWFRL